MKLIINWLTISGCWIHCHPCCQSSGRHQDQIHEQFPGRDQDKITFGANLFSNNVDSNLLSWLLELWFWQWQCCSFEINVGIVSNFEIELQFCKNFNCRVNTRMLFTVRWEQRNKKEQWHFIKVSPTKYF